MRKKGKRVTAWLLALVLLVSVLPMSVSAEADGTEGYLSYTIGDGEVEITDCYTWATDEIVIPKTIEGIPVTRIGNSSFEG